MQRARALRKKHVYDSDKQDEHFSKFLLTNDDYCYAPFHHQMLYANPLTYQSCSKHPHHCAQIARHRHLRSDLIFHRNEYQSRLQLLFCLNFTLEVIICHPHC